MISTGSPRGPASPAERTHQQVPPAALSVLDLKSQIPIEPARGFHVFSHQPFTLARSPSLAGRFRRSRFRGTMTALFLGAFIGGLVLGVRVMLFGIERRNKPAPVESARRGLRISIPLIAAFAVGFGAGGYIASRTASTQVAFLVAISVGAAAALLMRWIIAKSAAMVPEHDVEDERYVLQGHIARVVAAIAPGVVGEIAFEVGNVHRSLRARSLDDLAVAAGTEVVIERIEGDLAFVEPWVHVERRL